jgi:hypothetical protein
MYFKHLLTLVLLVLLAGGLWGQQRQRILPLPAAQWKQKQEQGEFVIGSYLEKVSARTELISFHAALPDNLNSKEKWHITYFAPATTAPLIVIQEKQPIDYIRLESAKMAGQKNRWKTCGPWTLAPNNIPAANMAVLIQYNNTYFVPALLYQSQKPAKIQSYRAVFMAGTAIKSGEYVVSQGSTILHRGNIGRQLGGNAFHINIPYEKMPKTGGLVQVKVSLVEADQQNGPQLLFDFYHQPYP